MMQGMEERLLRTTKYALIELAIQEGLYIVILQIIYIQSITRECAFSSLHNMNVQENDRALDTLVV
jgi:hypothetical protein